MLKSLEETLRKQFLEAAKTGNLQGIKLAVDSIEKIEEKRNFFLKYGTEFLINAACNNQFPAVRAFIDSGANYDNVKWLYSFFTEAIIEGDVDKISIAARVSEPFSNRIFARYGWALLNLAVERGYYNVAELLLQKGVGLNGSRESRNTALMIASQNSNLEMARLLVDNDADVSVASAVDGATALMLAAQEGNIEMVKILKRGKNFYNSIEKQKDNEGITALILATFRNHLEMVKLLESEGANIDQQDFNGITALMYATHNNNLEMIQFFLEKGASVFFEEANTGITVLDYALSSGLHDASNIFLDTLLKIFADEEDLAHNLEEIRSLLNIISRDQPGEMTNFLSQESTSLNGILKTKDEKLLQELLMFAVNNHKFVSASELLSHPEKGLLQYEKIKPPISSEGIGNKYYEESKEMLENDLDFSRAGDYDQAKVIQGFSEIARLLGDGQRCVKYLSKLNNKILENGLSFPSLEHETMKIHSLKWPKFPDNGYEFVDKQSLLTRVIKEHLQRFDIENSVDEIKFSGLVDSEEANKIPASGRLFKEAFLSSGSLAHGVMSHYLQWYLITCAYEEGYIETDLSPRELLEASVGVFIKDTNMPVWAALIDSNIFCTQDDVCDNFFSPHALNSFLLTNDNPQLRDLKSYMLDSFYKYASKISDAYKDKNFPDRELPIATTDFTNVMIASLTSTGSNFDLVDFFDRNDVRKYYKEKGRLGDINIEKSQVGGGDIIYKRPSTRGVENAEGSLAKVQAEIARG